MTVESPCVRLCNLVNDVCTGCNRTKEEIMAWRDMPNDERVKVIERLKNTGNEALA